MYRLIFLLTLFVLAACQPVAQGSFAGSWHGVLNLGGPKLTLVLHFSAADDGTTTCLMDSPDQGAKGIPATVRHISADSVSIAVARIGMSFAGKLARDEIRGEFSQGLARLPLTFKRGELTRVRPQNPALPLPYATEEVAFRNAAANATLAGTLSYPVGYKAGDKVPVVLMVSGSGLQNRDEEVFDHKPFLVIADHLARNGVASLRYDDRGCGKSTGDASQATTLDFAADASAGLDFLRDRQEFGKMGVLGHSEGASIAFMLGAEGKADFVVSVAGIGVPADTALAAQVNAMMQMRGIPATMTARQYSENAAKQGSPWLDYFVGYDPTAHIKACRVPVMAVNGGKDMQVVCPLNLQGIRSSLPVGGNNMVKEYPELNHLMQHCQTGAVEEYSQIAETVSPMFLNDLVIWVKRLDD